MADVAAMDIIIGAKVDGAVQGMNVVQRELAQTAVAANKTDSSFQKVSATAGKSSQTMLNLNRVIQDLPFGFTAISNNLTQLIPGVGLLGTAFTILTTAITFSQVGLSMWSRESKKAKEETDEFAKSLDSAKAGAISIGVQLQNFINIAKDTTKPLNERNEALREANKLMGEHGTKLTLANVATKAITEQTNLFTQALVNQAVAAKYADRIADLIIQQTEASKAYGKELTSFKLLQKDLNQLSQTSISFGVQNTTIYNELAVAQGQVTKKANEYKDVTKQLQETQGDFAKSSEKATAALGEIGHKATKAAKDIRDTFPTWEEQLALHRRISDSAKNLSLAPLFQLIDLSALRQGTQSVQDYFKAWQKGQEELKKWKDERLVSSVADLTADLDKRTDKRREQQQEQFEGIMKLAQGLQNVFTDVFTSIANGGQNMVQSLIHALEQLIIKLAAAAAAALVISAIFPGAAGFTSIFGKLSGLKGIIPGLQHGGIVSGPTLAMIGEAGPEVVFPLDRIRDFMQPNAASVVVMDVRVRGNELWLIQNREQQRRNRTY